MSDMLQFYSKAAEVTPGEVIDETHAIYVGSEGDLAVTIGGNNVIFRDLPAGFHNLRVTKIITGDTLASDIVALYRGSSL